MDLGTLVLAIIPLLVVVDPPASIAFFLTLGSERSTATLRKIAFRACAFATMVLLFFAFSGEALLTYMHVEMYSLQAAGGLLLGLIGMSMLKEGEKPSYEPAFIPSGEQFVHETPVDFSLVPLGMPMLAGPGSISLVILLGTNPEFSTNMVAMATIAVMTLSLLMFILVSSMSNFLSDNAVRIITRIMGLLTVVIAAQYLFDGLAAWHMTLGA
jgi:multiple antibiotic resistance protein